MSTLIKTDIEIKAMQKAANLAVKCMKFISYYLISGITELEVAEKIKSFFMSNGATDLAFPSIVAFGENSADPHHEPTNRKLKKKDVVVIDIGCVCDGYCSDITRTFLPKKPTEEQLNVYNIVLKANKTGIAKAKVRMKANHLDKICRDIIEKNGYAKNFIHSTGHGIGKVVHEEPKIGLSDETLLQNNMFFTIEPGIYIENEFGIRIEDTVTLNNGKIIVLTSGMAK